MPDQVDKLDRLLRSVNHSVMTMVRGAAEAHGIPHQGLAILRHVHMEPGSTVSELARRTGMAKSNISKTVDSLVSLGMIEKRSDPADQRLVRIFNTPRANEHFEEVRQAVHARLTALAGALSPTQLDALIVGLEAIETALGGERR